MNLPVSHHRILSPWQRVYIVFGDNMLYISCRYLMNTICATTQVHTVFQFYIEDICTHHQHSTECTTCSTVGVICNVAWHWSAHYSEWLAAQLIFLPRQSLFHVLAAGCSIWGNHLVSNVTCWIITIIIIDSNKHTHFFISIHSSQITGFTNFNNHLRRHNWQCC